ncbi:GHKL domain-containing protein [Sporosarcina sp. GW1-11]|uniref:sensor histidine kinase n=1 Tax=Sporosarcina sp. GW1-11 TaxID=2899126 RepID=UPI00294BC01E|nr:GHKL domain-containing protein [Sporosarcina sp. GW1-11]MDV6377858.1 GHKL domain-containing protein [Sporosarcina sp. GW1-11]
MTTTFVLFSLFNFFIIYGSLFYIMNLHVTIKRFILCMLVNALVSVLAYIFPQSIWISIAVSITLSTGLIYLFSKQHMVYFHLLTIYISSILVEYAVLFLVSIFHLSLVVHGSLIVLLLTIIMLGYKKFLTHYNWNQVNLAIRSQMVLFLIATITIIVFYKLIFVTAQKGDIQISITNLIILSSYFIIMITLTRILLFTMMKEQSINAKLIEQQLFNQYMQSLEQVNRDMQNFRHDHANILLSLRGYIENDDIIGLKKYFEEKIVKVEQQTLFKNQLFSQLDRLQIIEIKGLISTKLLLADELSIPISVEVPKMIKDISIDRLHLSRILGVFLDNAIEASASLDAPQINLAFLSMTNEIIIVIENKLLNSEISIQQLFTERYSTKGEHRGFGLSSVRNVLSGYPNITWNSRIENQWFIHEIIIRERITVEGDHM